jgi:hypothetical protein
MITDPKIIEKIKNSNARIISVKVEDFQKMIHKVHTISGMNDIDMNITSESYNNQYKIEPPPFIEIPTKIEVKLSHGKGMGVFAVEKILSGEIIETCSLITLPKDGDVLTDYRFLYPKNTMNEFVIPLGYGCIYNHSDKPNATWVNHPQYKAFNFVAIKDIEINEEICTYYGGELYWNSRQNINVI